MAAARALTCNAGSDSCFRMMVVREMRRRAKVLVGPLFGIALTVYFGYHLVEGDRGLKAWVHLTQELHRAQGNLAAVAADRQRLAYRVSQMQPDHIDPDLLDQQVRKILDVAAPDEIVIMAPHPVEGGTPARSRSPTASSRLSPGGAASPHP
jgi:cell division protein FtsB